MTLKQKEEANLGFVHRNKELKSELDKCAAEWQTENYALKKEIEVLTKENAELRGGSDERVEKMKKDFEDRVRAMADDRQKLDKQNYLKMSQY